MKSDKVRSAEAAYYNAVYYFGRTNPATARAKAYWQQCKLETKVRAK